MAKNKTAKMKIPVRIQGTALNTSAVQGACLPQSKICFEFAHVWFISVYSINIFLELYAKDRTDYCWANSKHIFDCGRQAPWTAEVFNAVPWILTGIFIFAVLFFAIRWSLVNSIGARLTPSMGKQVAEIGRAHV